MNKPIPLPAPTPDDIKAAWREDDHSFEQVHEDADPSWRHGCYMFTVFQRTTDNTFWGVNWQLSGDGEYNSIRDGDLSQSDISQVRPVEVVKTEYVALH